MPRASHRLPDANGSDVSLCLTNAELAELTDYRQPAAQRRVLLGWGFHFDLTATGEIELSRAEVRRQMGRGVRLTRVYLIRAESRPRRLKIGLSDDPARRLRSLQVGSPVPLTLLAHVLGSREKERYLHRRFAHLRSHGEWFEDRAVVRRAFGL